MRKNIIVAMASLAFLPAVSFAAAPTLSEVLDASGISAAGHASASYAYDHPQGANSTNTFAFDQARLQISKLPAEGFGALVDVYAGQDVVGGNYNYGGGFDTFGGGGEINLNQAFVQYATGGLTVIAGKFATLAGYEVASDALNTNATRSILFANQAFTLTGVRAGYKFNDIVTAYVGVSNNANLNQPQDANSQKTVELGVALAPATGLTVTATDYIGNQGGSGNKTNLADVVVAYTLGNLGLGVNADYNTIKESGAGIKTKFTGVALYANYQVLPSFRAGIRGEITSSKDDAADTKGKASEITLTGAYNAAKNFDLVTDVRFSKGDATVYDDTADDDKDTKVVVKAIFKF